MADPISITGGVFGLIATAIAGVRALHDDLQQFKDAPKTLKHLTEDLGFLSTQLNLLQNTDEWGWKYIGERVTEASHDRIILCGQSCSTFRSDLQQWTRHSADGKVGIRDRTIMTFLKRGDVQTMSKQLQDCKEDICLMATVANLSASARNNEMTDEIRGMVAQTNEDLRGVLATRGTEQRMMEVKMEKLNLGSEDDDMGEPDIHKIEKMRQYEEERKAIIESQRLLRELLSRAQEKEVAKVAAKSTGDSSTTGNVSFGDQNSGFQTGSITGGVRGMTFGRN